MTTWIWIVLLLCVAMVAGAVFFRSYASGGSSGGLFGAKAEKRLEVVEQAWVDNRRRLIIIRRDNVEHLIMTGGPVDIVIEDRIGAQPAARSRPTLADVPAAVASFGSGRTQRPGQTPTVGPSQAAGE